jgi:hypothetical protein
MILMSVVPLVQATAGPLLSRVPVALEPGVVSALEAVSRLPDVARVEQPHVWKHHAEVVVGTVHVLARPDADEQRLLRAVRGLLSKAGVTDLTVQINKDPSTSAAAAAAGGIGGGGGGSTVLDERSLAPRPYTSSSAESRAGNNHGHSHGHMDAHELHGHSHG